MGKGALDVILVLLACLHRPPLVVPPERSSRPGAGTIVGITVPAGSSAALVDAAYAALEAEEAVLSEWRSDSRSAAIARGEAVVLAPRQAAFFAEVEAVRQASGGAFDVCHKGGRLLHAGDAWRGEGCAGLDLGGALKGWLAETAAAALVEGGLQDFVVDAGGDIVARGSAPGQARGWPVTVAVGGQVQSLWLQDQALSSSGEDQQPGHIVDARDGTLAEGWRGVWVTAPRGVVADAWATALYASGEQLPLPEGVCAGGVGAEGLVRWCGVSP